MKTKQQLDLLSAKVAEAYRNYRQAIEDNLLELGHPVSVQDTCNQNERGITLSVMNDNRVSIGIFDQIRCRKSDIIEVHYISWDYANADDWMYLSDLGDATDYVLDAIQWFDDVKLKVVDGDVWSGTANEVYSFCSPEIALYFVHEDGRIEDVAWYDSIDHFIDIPGAFAVEEKYYDEALKQIEEHYATIQ